MVKFDEILNNFGVNKIFIEIDEKDLYAIRVYEEFINKHVELKNKIPARVIKKFFSFFGKKTNQNYVINQLKQKEINVFVLDIKKQVLERFIHNDEYNFSVYKYSLQLMLDEIFNSISESLLSLWDKIDRSKKKEVLIFFVYMAINNYFELCDSDLKISFGKYKKIALTGFIIYKFGFHLSQKITPNALKGKNPTNEQFYESIKYYIKKIK